MRKRLLIVILIISALFLYGCKNKKEDVKKYSGIYKGVYTKYVGDEEKTEDNTFSLTLNEDGTGTHFRDGYSLSVSWKVENDVFYMTEVFLGMNTEYYGTITDENIQLYNGNKDDITTLEYYYSK